MTPDIDLDALTALERDATPAPWEATALLTLDEFVVTGGPEAYAVGRSWTAADAVLIAAMRNTWPALLSALTATRAELDEALRQRDTLRMEMSHPTVAAVAELVKDRNRQYRRAESAHDAKDEANRRWLDATKAAGAGDGEQDTATCGHAYIGNEGEFTCTLYAPHPGRHWNVLAEFAWTDAPLVRHQRADVGALIEQSSLGTPEAVALRKQTDDETARRIVERSTGIGKRADIHDEILAFPCPSCGVPAGMVCVNRKRTHSHIKRRTLAASVQGAADGEVCTPPMGIANETACLLAPMHAGLCEPPVPTHPNAEGADADGEAQA